MMILGTHVNALAAAVLLFITLQRLFELWLAQRNTTRLLARGAVEISGEHYPVIVALHAAWLAGLWIFAIGIEPSLPLLGLFALLQAGRIWVLATLGERWTTRIIVIPGAPLIRRGPYRFLSHPNYVVVALEIAVLPLAFGLIVYAVVFTILNAAVLRTRISAEGKALGELSAVGAPARMATRRA